MSDKQKQARLAVNRKSYHGEYCCLKLSYCTQRLITEIKNKSKLTDEQSMFLKLAFDCLLSTSLLLSLLFAEKEQNRNNERAAWRFLEESFASPLRNLAALPTALATHKDKYAALDARQKEHLHSTLLPLLNAKKAGLAAEDTARIKGRIPAVIIAGEKDARRPSRLRLSLFDRCVLSSSNNRKKSQFRSKFLMSYISIES